MRNLGCKAHTMLCLMTLSACATDSPQVSSSRFNPIIQDLEHPPPKYPDLRPPKSINESFTWTEELMREYSLAGRRASEVKPRVATALTVLGTLGLLRAAVDPEPRMTGGLAALGLGAYAYGSGTQWESRAQIYAISSKALSCRMDVARPFLASPEQNETKVSDVLMEAKHALAKVYATLPAVEALDLETIIPAVSQSASNKEGCSPPPPPCTPPVGAAKDDMYMPRCLAERKAYDNRCKTSSSPERRITADPLIKTTISAVKAHIKKAEDAIHNVETRIDDSYQAGLWLWIETHWVKGQSDQDLVATTPDLDSLVDKLALKLKPPESTSTAGTEGGDANATGTAHSGQGNVPLSGGKNTREMSALDHGKLNALNEAVANSQRALSEVTTLESRYMSRPKIATLSSAMCPMPRAKQAVATGAIPSTTANNRPGATIPPDSVDDKVWIALGLVPKKKDPAEFERRAKVCKADGLKLPNVIDGSITSEIQQRIIDGACTGVKYP